MNVLICWIFARTTKLNVSTHWEVLNVCARKALWKLTGSVSLMTRVWVSNVIPMLCATLFADVYANPVTKETEKLVWMKMNAILLAARVI